MEGPAVWGRRIVAQNIVAVSRARGLSDSFVARRAGCARSHYRDVLRCDAAIGLDLFARVAWALEVDPAALLEIYDPSVGPPPYVCSTKAPIELRVVLARNVRGLAFARFGRVRVAEIAANSGWHPSRISGLLAKKVSLCIERLMPLAITLRATPADLLRVAAPSNVGSR